MLSWIEIKNFKAIRDINLNITSLNVLAGMNGAGKSTFLQMLGLLKQTYNSDSSPEGVHLSGDLLQLGVGRDVLSETNTGKEDIITFSLKDGGRTFSWSCLATSEENLLKFKKKPRGLPSFLKTDGFQFLQADRIVPQTLYPRADQSIRKAGFLGAKGEFTADFLSQNISMDVPQTRHSLKNGLGITSRLLETISPTGKLGDQVSGWLQQLSPGARVSFEPVQGTDNVKLQYTYFGRKRDVASSLYRPTNVGFGLTYVLPIIVAALSAKAGDLLLIENPEAHLHPQGQAALGELLCRCAKDGVQIIVETHSDHLLNGIRLSVKNQIISSKDVSLNFFSRPVEEGEVYVESPAILDNGKLSNWPDGFFDQWEKAIDSLI